MVQKKADKAKKKFGRQAKQLVLVIFVSMIFTGAYTYFVYKPLYIEYQSVRKKYTNLDQEVAELTKKPLDRNAASQKRTADKKNKETKSELDGLKEQVLADKEEGITLLTQVNELAEAYSLKVQGMDPMDGKEVSKRELDPKGIRLKRNYYQVNIIGPFSGVVRFFEDLQNLPKLVTVERISLHRQKKGLVSEIILVI